MDMSPNETPIRNDLLQNMREYSNAELRVALAVWSYPRGRELPPTVDELAEITGVTADEVRAAVKSLYARSMMPKFIRVTYLDPADVGQKFPVGRLLRAKIFERDNYECKICAAVEDLTIDHIKPQVLGGEATEENLRVLCRSCNSRKGAKYEITEELFIE